MAKQSEIVLFLWMLFIATPLNSYSFCNGIIIASEKLFGYKFFLIIVLFVKTVNEKNCVFIASKFCNFLREIYCGFLINRSRRARVDQNLFCVKNWILGFTIRLAICEKHTGWGGRISFSIIYLSICLYVCFDIFIAFLKCAMFLLILLFITV